MLLLCTVIFGLWRDTHGVSPVPSVPNLVPALAGSCVVIPCSFTPPASHSVLGRQGSEVGVMLRYRTTGYIFPLRSTAFSTDDKFKVSKEFLGRTSLWGNTDDGDCSVMIDRVHLADSYVYELALKGRGQKDWGEARSVGLVAPTLQWRWERGAQENNSEYGSRRYSKPGPEAYTTGLSHLYRIVPHQTQNEV
ncbi:unnamed protein product [Coregonus sp. 'balchen']|nr:unnamed protein product [Coregonus sp. 'balchen']